ncbi:MAG: hypothetical protein ACM3OB_02100 [Acidobacteriota bacterium]
MKLALGLVLLGAVLGALHVVALWAERRGWIYYRHRRASPGTLGSALLEAHSLLEPAQKQVLEAQREPPRGGEAAGDPPRAGED